MPSDPLQPDEKPTVNFWGVPLCMMNHFALAIFKIFCLFLSLGLMPILLERKQQTTEFAKLYVRYLCELPC